MAGKPGAARKALEALLQSDDLSRQLLGPDRTAILEDEIDEQFGKLFPKGDDDIAAAGSEEGVPPLASHEEEGEDENEQVAPVVVSREELEAEAKTKGFGKLYAALGGGKKGLEACVAVEALCEVRGREGLETSVDILALGD